MHNRKDSKEACQSRSQATAPTSLVTRVPKNLASESCASASNLARQPDGPLVRCLLHESSFFLIANAHLFTRRAGSDHPCVLTTDRRQWPRHMFISLQIGRVRAGGEIDLLCPASSTHQHECRAKSGEGWEYRDHWSRHHRSVYGLLSVEKWEDNPREYTSRGFEPRAVPMREWVCRRIFGR